MCEILTANFTPMKLTNHKYELVLAIPELSVLIMVKPHDEDSFS